MGHTSIKITEHYVCNRRGEKVEPTKEPSNVWLEHLMQHVDKNAFVPC
ncbi:hypothetical protein EBME_2361 [bacterium endosymbiont of Mortierella elongata FMR23-6]|nr:hypothetical protein EBME_2361 [bacterium endosymbiont of Mortierella elongata FMR23-6]